MRLGPEMVPAQRNPQVFPEGLTREHRCTAQDDETTSAVGDRESGKSRVEQALTKRQSKANPTGRRESRIDGHAGHRIVPDE